MQHALVTGGAGFVGSHVVDHLLDKGFRVTVVDNFDAFYDVEDKRRNCAGHLSSPAYRLVEADIRDEQVIDAELRDRYDVVVHLAARAGVRPSIEQPLLYQDVNVRGTQVLLEFARRRGIGQFVFASSSSVYGMAPRVPWHEEDAVLLPISPYASTKVSGELLGHVYSKLFGIRFLSLRFFTVYGPRQRPDLAIRKFTTGMMRGDTIPVFGDGSSRRDYTYIDDIVQGVLAAIAYTGSPYEVINLGNSRAVSLLDLIDTISATLGVRPRIDWQPCQPGDVPQTWASIDKAGQLLGYAPRTPLYDGIRQFAAWMEERNGRRNHPAVDAGYQGATGRSHGVLTAH